MKGGKGREREMTEGRKEGIEGKEGRKELKDGIAGRD
jgi:hypothetical protein